MNNFMYSIPTKIYFGKGEIRNLGREAAAYGSRVLLVYGGGSIKQTGLYQTALQELEGHGLIVSQLSGVEPNPRITSVRAGVTLCRREHVDVVVAVGGGSVIDCAKIIAAGARYDGDAWELVEDGSKIRAALPLLSVLTLSATGTEMDPFAVISDMATRMKLGTASEHIKPKVSILDPTYTYSVSKKQTAAGTADMMSHIFENYFTRAPGAYVQAQFCKGLLRTCVKYGPLALEQPENYEARANLMWTSSLAINGLLSLGAGVAWSVHPIEHELSAFYDITHGEGLAILTPCWMEYILNEQTASKLADYGREVLGIHTGQTAMQTAKEAIAKTRDFFLSLGLPATLTELGITDEHFAVMAEKAVAIGGLQDAYVPLTNRDVEQIYRMAL